MHWQFWLFFIIFITIRFFPFIFGKTLVFGDNYSLMMPGKIFTAEWLKQGVLPLWNPHVFAGMPWFSDINQSVIYPSTIFFIFFPPAIALNLLLISHALIAYGGMYLLVKHWLKDHWWALVAGGLWMFSTQVSGSMNNFSTVQSLVWLPLLSYLGLKLVKEKSAKILFALAVTLQFLGGYPQHVIYGIALAVGLSLFVWLRENNKTNFSTWTKSWFFPWTITALLTLLLSAIAWIPFTEMLFKSTRMEQTTTQALVGSLQPAMLIKFVLPYFFDNPASGMKWGPAWSGQPNVGIYVTWLGLLALATSFFVTLTKLINRKKLVKEDQETLLFFLITLFSLIFSLGQYLPGFEFIQKLFPLFRIARYPSMVMIVTNVVMILWAVRALQKWQLSKQQFRLWLLFGIGLFIASLFGLLGWHYGFEWAWHWLDSFVSFSLSSGSFHTLERDKIIVFEILRNILFNSIFFIASIYFFWTKKTRIVALILVLELLVNTQGLFYFAPNKIYDLVTPNSQQLLQKMGMESDENKPFHYRALTRNSNMPYTDYGSYWEAMVVRVPFSDSFVDEQELVDFKHVQNLRDGMTPDWNMVFGLPVVNGYATLLPSDYAKIWQVTDQPRINFVDQINPNNKLLDDWAVKYYLVDSWFKLDEDLSNFSLIGVVGEDNRWWVLERPTALDRFRFEDNSIQGITAKKETPGRVDLVINNEGYESLIMADRYDDNWRVFINNEEKSIENFNGMRKVKLDDGEQVVTFVYYPKWFIFGFIISGLTAISMGIWWWLNMKKGKL
ncbi:MAG: hypothetical protein CO040_03600 [Candidatus Pacebacteria bacterium CG_4_9_14_0_2_um_filter_36_8]|nr:MAG: hypothetical protein CO040_03600 [Candidatus Pacebacteria bacterium CG_4_9_14_0_2_um_filter_36_8]